MALTVMNGIERFTGPGCSNENENRARLSLSYPSRVAYTLFRPSNMDVLAVLHQMMHLVSGTSWQSSAPDTNQLPRFDNVS